MKKISLMYCLAFFCSTVAISMENDIQTQNEQVNLQFKNLVNESFNVDNYDALKQIENMIADHQVNEREVNYAFDQILSSSLESHFLKGLAQTILNKSSYATVSSAIDKTLKILHTRLLNNEIYNFLERKGSSTDIFSTIINYSQNEHLNTEIFTSLVKNFQKNDFKYPSNIFCATRDILMNASLNMTNELAEYALDVFSSDNSLKGWLIQKYSNMISNQKIREIFNSFSASLDQDSWNNRVFHTIIMYANSHLTSEDITGAFNFFLNKIENQITYVSFPLLLLLQNVPNIIRNTIDVNDIRHLFNITNNFNEVICYTIARDIFINYRYALSHDEIEAYSAAHPVFQQQINYGGNEAFNQVYNNTQNNVLDNFSAQVIAELSKTSNHGKFRSYTQEEFLTIANNLIEKFNNLLSKQDLSQQNRNIVENAKEMLDALLNPNNTRSWFHGTIANANAYLESKRNSNLNFRSLFCFLIKINNDIIQIAEILSNARLGHQDKNQQMTGRASIQTEATCGDITKFVEVAILMTLNARPDIKTADNEAKNRINATLLAKCAEFSNKFSSKLKDFETLKGEIIKYFDEYKEGEKITSKNVNASQEQITTLNNDIQKKISEYKESIINDLKNHYLKLIENVTQLTFSDPHNAIRVLDTYKSNIDQKRGEALALMHAIMKYKELEQNGTIVYEIEKGIISLLESNIV